MKIPKSSLEHIITLLLFISLLLGGIANSYIFEIIGLVSFFSLFLISLHRRQKILFPQGSLFFLLFICFQLISLSWTENIFNSIEYIVLFVSSFFLLMFFYNFKEFGLKTRKIEKIIIILGVIFGILYIFTQVIPITFLKTIMPENYCNLYSPYSQNHNLIGDYWTLIAIVAIFRLAHEQSFKHVFLISLSLTFIILSQSRSAILCLLIALYFFLNLQNLPSKLQTYIKYFTYLMLGIFLYLSTTKTTIFSRPYYIQAIVYLTQNPLGAGMGNFKVITENLNFQSVTLIISRAAKAHNIFLEVFCGIGILGTAFILWLISSLREIFKNIKKVNPLYLTIFITISVNFFFNVTYAVPTMLWLWFASLGIIQSSVKNN